MEIRWLRKALDNLNNEAEYIATENPQAAAIVVQRIHRAVAILADNPAAGRPGRVAGTRELLVPNTRYLIPYRVRRERVEIFRVFHMSRRTPTHW